MIKERNSYNRVRARIVVEPHYIGTEKSSKLFKEILLMQIKKKIEKSA